MRRIKEWIKDFIVRTVVEDYRKNGKTRQTLKADLEYAPGYVPSEGTPHAVYIGTTTNGTQFTTDESF